MIGVSVLSIAKGIENQLDKMVKNANLLPGYLDRVVYRQYQKAQRKRWETENSDNFSAGGHWEALDPGYAAYKRKKFASYRGGGEKILIATGRLFEGVIGPSQDHEKLVTERQIIISTSVPYAHYVDEDRTFTKFSPMFYSDVYQGLKEYLVKSLERAF